MMPTSYTPPGTPPEVVIVYRTPLFAQGIESLLRAEGVGGVVKVAAGEASIPERIRDLDPQIVVIEDARNHAQDLLPSILEAIPWVIRVALDGAPAEIYRHAHHQPDSTIVRLIARIARRDGRDHNGRSP